MCGGEGYRALLVTRDVIGEGEPELGRILMEKWFRVLADDGDAPGLICFMHHGVRLCLEGHPVLGHLDRIKETGTTMLVCGTCLEWWRAEDRLAVGVKSNMADIQYALSEAQSVITL